MSIDHGLIFDYAVKSLVCFTCRKHPNASLAWKEKHSPDCTINHERSSGAMEKDGAVEIFTRSIDKHKLKYTVFVGDGDSSSFGAVVSAVKKYMVTIML